MSERKKLIKNKVANKRLQKEVYEYLQQIIDKIPYKRNIKDRAIRRKWLAQMRSVSSDHTLSLDEFITGLTKIFAIPNEIYNLTPVLIRAFQCAKKARIKSRGSLKYPPQYYDFNRLHHRMERTELRIALWYIHEYFQYSILFASF